MPRYAIVVAVGLFGCGLLLFATENRIGSLEKAVSPSTEAPFVSKVTPLGRCATDLQHFCISKKGVHLFTPDTRVDVVEARRFTKQSRWVVLALGLVGTVLLLYGVSDRSLAARAMAGLLLVVFLAVVLFLENSSSAEEPQPTSPPTPPRRSRKRKPFSPLPYCQEMSEKDPPFPHVVSTGKALAPVRPAAFVYPTTPFWLTPWHLWLNLIAAYDTVQRHNLKDAEVVVMWYFGVGYRWGPTYYPLLAKEDKAHGPFPFATFYHALGARAIGMQELDEPRCYERGVQGVRLWDEGLTRAVKNNSYGTQFSRGLVRSWMERLTTRMGFDMHKVREQECRHKDTIAIILQRKEGRKVLEEARLLDVMTKAGWNASAYYSERHTLAEQFQAFIRADVIVSVFGSGLTWLPFMRARGVVLVIIPERGAGGDKYLPGLNGPNLTINRHTAFGTWSLHLHYYTVTSGAIPSKFKKKGRAHWKNEPVVVPADLFETFVSKAAAHLRERQLANDSCQGW